MRSISLSCVYSLCDVLTFCWSVSLSDSNISEVCYFYFSTSAIRRSFSFRTSNSSLAIFSSSRTLFVLSVEFNSDTSSMSPFYFWRAFCISLYRSVALRWFSWSFSCKVLSISLYSLLACSKTRLFSSFDSSSRCRRLTISRACFASCSLYAERFSTLPTSYFSINLFLISSSVSLISSRIFFS